MMKLTIFNLRDFLAAVNHCRGAVNLLCPDGRKQDLRKHAWLQEKLSQEYAARKGCLRLSLEVPDPKDHLHMVCYYIGDC